MLFNSIDFFIFLPLVFSLYWFVCYKNLKLQNLLIVISSYVFYGWWDWRFLSLILFSTLVDYFIGRGLKNENNNRNRKLLLWISILVNLGFLGFFKYYNFFVISFAEAFTLFGSSININTLNIILPVGISFYTFQTLSYSIDVYKRKLEPTNDFIGFAAFVCFFPQLVAGPIERGTHLLPQILNKRTFSFHQAVQGSKLIIWGLFKKVVIADSLSFHVNNIFNNYKFQEGGVLWLGLIYFSIQIYCDFSGYSNIARGVSNLFGFNLIINFKTPYFSRNIGEFWNRWHISLSTWFRDYIYIPLGGSRVTKFKAIRNIFVIFLVSGFWHGSNLTYLFWGLVHAIIYIPTFIIKSNKTFSTSVVACDRFFPTLKEIFQMLLTYFCVLISWVFFRSDTITDAFNYLKIMFFEFNLPKSNLEGVGYLLIFILFDWFSRKDFNNLNFSKFIIVKWLIFLFFSYQILIHFGKVSNDFIYFQF